MSKKMYVIQIVEEKYLNLESTSVSTTSEFLTKENANLKSYLIKFRVSHLFNSFVLHIVQDQVSFEETISRIHLQGY